MTGIIITAIICGTILALAGFFITVVLVVARMQKQVAKTANDVFTRVDKTFDEDDITHT